MPLSDNSVARMVCLCGVKRLDDNSLSLYFLPTHFPFPTDPTHRLDKWTCLAGVSPVKWRSLYALMHAEHSINQYKPTRHARVTPPKPPATVTRAIVTLL